MLKRLQIRSIPTLLLSVMFVSTAHSSATVKDGIYYCTIGRIHIGSIKLDKGTYSGPAFDGQFDRFQRYTLEDGTITWGGSLGGISLAGEVVSTRVINNGPEELGFEITIKNQAGRFQSVLCVPEK